MRQKIWTSNKDIAQQWAIVKKVQIHTTTIYAKAFCQVFVCDIQSHQSHKEN